MSSSSGAGGLSGTVSANATIAKKGLSIDILNELGISQKENNFQLRTRALAEPLKYAAEREKQVDIMKARVTATYDSVRADLENSGLSIGKILELAQNAADATYQTELAVLEVRFPSGSNDAAQQSAGKNSFPGMTAAPKAKAAAKPRAAPKPRKSRAKAAVA